jgi:hypothetical protein
LTSPSLLQRRARCLRWRTVWGVRCARSRARGAERRQSRPHTASPMGLRKLHRGRGGSRHFRRHRGFIPEGSLFVSLRATGYLLTRAACLLSVRLKKNVGTKRRPQDVRFTELLIGGKKKNRSVVKKIQYHHIERKEYAICCISRKIIVP